jgi:hypothetical protein
MARESDYTPLFTLPRWSFGLRQLFLWTAAIALGLVALRSASPTWVSAMLGLAVATLSTSLLLVIFRRGQQRAYWIGFATFGWLYLLLLFGSWTLGRTATNNSPLRAQNLLTQRLSAASYHSLYDEAFDSYNATVRGSTAPVGSMRGGDYGGMMPGGEGDSGYGGDAYGAGYSSGMGSVMLGGVGGPVAAPGPPPGPNENDFVNVAHALWAMLFAAIGGCVAGWLYQTSPGQTDKLKNLAS